MTAARYLMLLFVLSALAVAVVAQQARSIHLGYQVKRLEDRRGAIVEENRRLLRDISALSHPVQVADAAERMNIGLLDPVVLSQASVAEGPEAHHLTTRRRSH